MPFHMTHRRPAHRILLERWKLHGSFLLIENPQESAKTARLRQSRPFALRPKLMDVGPRVILRNLRRQALPDGASSVHDSDVRRS